MSKNISFSTKRSNIALLAGDIHYLPNVLIRSLISHLGALPTLPGTTHYTFIDLPCKVHHQLFPLSYLGGYKKQ